VALSCTLFETKLDHALNGKNLYASRDWEAKNDFYYVCSPKCLVKSPDFLTVNFPIPCEWYLEQLYFHFSSRPKVVYPFAISRISAAIRYWMVLCLSLPNILVYLFL
jgi:hypothetical protein